MQRASAELGGFARSTSFSGLRTLILLVALCMPAGAFAQTEKAAANAAVLAASPSRLVFAPGKTSSGWIRFEYFAGNRIFIPITINGRRVMAMLDSGASSTVLDGSFASKLGLKFQSDETGQGVNGSIHYGPVQGIELTLGDMRWSKGEAVAIDLAAVSRQLGRPLPVILGGEMFTDAVVEIDFKGHRIAFHDPATYAPPPNAPALPLTSVGESLAIAVLIENHPANLVFDLGNAGAIDLYPKFWEQPGFIGTRGISTSLAGGAGGMREFKTTMLSQIALGGTVFHDVPSRLSDGTTASDDRAGRLDGNIGIAILGRYHLIVDRPHNRVILDTPVDVSTPFKVNHAGLTLRPGGDGPTTVLHVAQGSPAAAAGLVAGDMIATVNGRKSSDPTVEEWQSGVAGRIVRLGLKDGRSITLTLAKYY